MSTDIDIARLPAYERISHEGIRQAVAAYDAARAALDEAKKATVQAKQELPQSQWKDAEIAEQRRHEGKPAPKARANTEQHEQRIADLEHEQRVGSLGLERAERNLRNTVHEHGGAWAEETEQTCAGLLEQWAAEASQITVLYSELAQAFAVRRVVIGDKQPRIGALEFKPEQVQGREWAGQQPSSVRPYITTADILAALSTVGTIEPEPEPVTQPALPRQRSPLEDMGPVQAEMTERQAGEQARQAAR